MEIWVKTGKGECMSDKSVSVHFPVLGILGVVFITLKLLGKIDWSWWWVLAPFWAPLVAVLGILGIVFVVGLLVMILERR